MKSTLAIVGVVLLILIGIFVFTMDKPENVAETPGELSLASSAFASYGTIPARYTCDGERLLSPPLSISNVPDGTQSLALIMDDPDVPKNLRPDGVFDHWVMFNITSVVTEISEGAELGVKGANGTGNPGYTGPCPPPEYEPTTHRYFFRLYALDTMLGLPEGATKKEVLEAMQGHVLDQAELVGVYDRTAQQGTDN